MPGGTREVAESCVDSLNMELVATYCKRLHPTKPDLAGRRIEAIGYQVGLQLAERYFYLYTLDRAACCNRVFAAKRRVQ